MGARRPTFAPEVQYPTDSCPDAISVSDFNGDGAPDLAVPLYVPTNGPLCLVGAVLLGHQYLPPAGAVASARDLRETHVIGCNAAGADGGADEVGRPATTGRWAQAKGETKAVESASPQNSEGTHP